MKSILLLTFVLTTICSSVFASIFEVSEIEGPVTTTTPATKKDDDFEVSAKKYEEFKDPIERNGAEVTNDETQFQFLDSPKKIRMANKNDAYVTYNLSPSDMIETAISRDDPSGTKMLLNLFFGSADENKTKYLFAAAEKCKPKVAKMLIQNGANPNDNSGADKWQALHVVTYNGCEEIAKMLIEKGVDVNAKIRIGYTPLCIAAQNGRDKIAKILVKHGADIDIRDSHAEHMTALEWAEKRGHQKVVDVINSFKDKLATNIENKYNSSETAIEEDKSEASIVENDDN